MEIIFEDKDIVVAIKPPEILSQGDERCRANAVDILKDMTGSEIFPVHRLDKGVGGVMVFAKNSKSAAELSRQVSDRTMEKTYLALLHGEITAKVPCSLFRNHKDATIYTLSEATKCPIPEIRVYNK